MIIVRETCNLSNAVKMEENEDKKVYLIVLLHNSCMHVWNEILDGFNFILKIVNKIRFIFLRLLEIYQEKIVDSGNQKIKPNSKIYKVFELFEISTKLLNF